MGAFDAIQQILDGAIAGTRMHQELVQSQDQHDAMLRQAAQQDRENRLADMKLAQSSRPVSQYGTVQDDPVSTSPPSMIGQMLAGSDVAGSGADMSNPFAAMGMTLPGAIRKADSSRTFDYKDPDGRVVRRELYTKDEQDNRAIDLKTREGLANGSLVQVSGDTTIGKMLGLKPGQTANISSTHAAGLANASTQDEMVGPTEDMQKYLGLTDPVSRRQFTALSASASRAKAAQAKADEAAARPIKSEVDNEGNLTLVYSDGTTKVIGKVASAKPVGTKTDNNGNVTVVYADGSSKAVGNVGAKKVPAATGAPPGVPATDPATLPSGIGQAPTVAQAHLFLQAAGGDRAKAKELLKNHRFRVVE